MYRNGVNDKKFSPNPANVGFLYVLVLNELLFLEIRISKKANLLLSTGSKVDNLLPTPKIVIVIKPVVVSEELADKHQRWEFIKKKS